MTDIAIRVDNLSKLYDLGARQQRPDTLRDALTGVLPRITRITRKGKDNSPNSRNSRQASQENSPNSPNTCTCVRRKCSRQGSQENSPNSPNSRQVPPSGSPDDLWALKDVSFEAKRGEVVGTPALVSGASVIGRNGAGTLAPARSAGESTLLKILSRITEPTSGPSASRPKDAFHA